MRFGNPPIEVESEVARTFVRRGGALFVRIRS
jgi:hypothetical protein